MKTHAKYMFICNRGSTTLSDLDTCAPISCAFKNTSFILACAGCEDGLVIENEMDRLVTCEV